MSIPPSTARASATKAVAPATDERSATIGTVSPPSVMAAAPIVSAWRPQTATCTPSATSASATANPRPFDAAATAARRPAIPRSITPLLGNSLVSTSVNRARSVAQRGRAATGAVRDHLGADGDGRLFGGAGTDVEPDRRHDLADLGVAQPRLPEPDDATLVGTPGSHCTHVADLRLHRGRDRGHVELVVVGEHANDITRTELGADGFEIAIGPHVLDFVGHRKALHRREHRARVADGDPEAEHLGNPGQRGGEVDRAEDDHPGRDDERLDEDGNRLLACFAVRPVVTRRAKTGLELAERVSRDHAIEVRIAERADRSAVRLHEHLRTDTGAVDDGDERDGLRRLHRGTQG